MRSIAASLLGMGLLQVALYAQQNPAAIQGAVKDPSGAAIPRATVVARHQATGFESRTVTNQAGVYSLPNLQIGEYTLTVSSPGFKMTEIPNIRLVWGEVLTFDVDLTLGSVTEKVEVTATAAQLDTTSSTTATSLVFEELRDLPVQLSGGPLNSLAFLRTLSLLTYDPTVVDSCAFAGGSIAGSNGFAFSDYTGYTIDGINGANNQFTPLTELGGLPPDTVAEFRLAFDFDAEKGGNNGNAVELVTKSGTNSLHGDVYGYVQNSALNSRNFFASRVSPEQQSEFGFTLGGPIRRNKTFFFGSYDGFRFRTTRAGVIATVPTEAMRQGDFRELLGPQVETDQLGRPIYQGEIYDPSTTRQLPDGSFIRDPFIYQGQLNVIDPSRLSSISQFFQQGYPLPTRSGTQLNWVGLMAPSPVNYDKFSIKVDDQIGEKHSLMAAMDFTPRCEQVSGGMFDPIISPIDNVHYCKWRPRGAYTWSIRPDLVFNVNGAIAWLRIWQGAYQFPSGNAGAKSGLKGVFTPDTPSVGISQTAGFGLGYWKIINPNVTAPILSSSLIWSKGQHTFKWGGEATQEFIGQQVWLNTSGSFSFSNLTTGFPGMAGSGWGYASYLLGEVDSASLMTPINARHSAWGWGFYGQDQWRATTKLTIHYGLRWNMSKAPHQDPSRTGQYGAFSPTVSNPAAGGRLGALNFWGTGFGRNGYLDSTAPNYVMLDPRFGLAYAPDQNTVIRAYYGIVHKPYFSSQNEGTTMPTYGSTATVTPTSLDAGLTPAFNWNDGFPAVPTIPNLDPSFLNGNSVQEVDYHNNTVDKVQALGFSVERRLRGGLAVRGEYIGKLTHGITRFGAGFPVPLNNLNPKYFSLGNLLLADINSPPAQAAGIPIPYPGFSGSVAQALRTYPQYLSVDQYNNTGGFSEYSAAHFALQKRFSAGLSFLVDYTFAKMLVSGPYQEGMQSTQKALSITDRPQSLAISYTYALPFGRGKRFLGNARGFVQQVMGDWEMVGVQNYFSGFPIQVGTEATIPAEEQVWAVRVPGVPITADSCSKYDPGNPSSRYLNINAFATPAPFTFGNVFTLPNVRNCGYKNENFSLFKNFQLTEKVRLKFGGEFFNAFNRHMWTGLGTDINNPTTFGTFTGATPPRNIQLQMKIEF
jgi:hypothetical protein